MTPLHNFIKSITLFLLFFTSKTNAQNVELYNSISNDVLTISSKVLNEDRRIYVHVPKTDSAGIHKTFPVLYLLDGENHFHILSAYIDYLSHWEVIPPIIVVGIISVDRKKDLTPSKNTITYDGKNDTTLKPSGGNEHFFQFIQKELMPYMEANYKTNSFKILGGHSFGGNTAINCLLNHRDMFDAYIAVSPSLWWDNRYLLKQADKKLIQSSVCNKILFYSDGNEGGSFHTALSKFDSLIVHKKLRGLRSKYKYYPGESHMTEPIVAYYDALRYIYKDWKNNDEK
ncbi:MAG: alpha/beta hydrolase-fold protein [Bacteroidota bacterium]